jgi:hypothetical protein
MYEGQAKDQATSPYVIFRLYDSVVNQDVEAQPHSVDLWYLVFAEGLNMFSSQLRDLDYGIFSALHKSAGLQEGGDVITGVTPYGNVLSVTWDRPVKMTDSDTGTVRRGRGGIYWLQVQ